MAKKFLGGVLTGTALTVASLAGAAFTFKKKVVEPEEQEAARIEENRRRAIRKSLSAHRRAK
ncbi:DUF3042 family protein [Holzapfeliella sp. He02]|uniref:DUF3042 family protein n=1 Tax=Holzapfeliella saturejae TaxID=3082953 RepID=A0ABU8SGW1_9LACO